MCEDKKQKSNPNSFLKSGCWYDDARMFLSVLLYLSLCIPSGLSAALSNCIHYTTLSLHKKEGIYLSIYQIYQRKTQKRMVKSVCEPCQTSNVWLFCQ